MRNKLPQIAIVGRANVGKSTLFNRLIEKNKALTSNIAGTTRDRNIGVAKWRGQMIELTDTGGLDVNSDLPKAIADGIVHQAKRAITNSDLVLFVFDAATGITPVDRTLAKELIKGGKKNKIILVGNKAETARAAKYDSATYQLGLGEPQFISAASGSGCGDLLDLILERLPRSRNAGTGLPDKTLPTIKIVLLGKPNVGKSSILNSILGEERVIVSDIPHTTREAHDTEFEYKNHDFIIFDTAGLRRQAKVERGGLEKKSRDKSLAALHHCDVAVLVTEVNKKIDVQDKKITQEILSSGKSVIIVANKWDLIKEKDTNTVNRFIDYYRTSFPYLWWAPVIFISAKEHLRSKKILDLIIDIKSSREIKISDSRLDKFLKSKIKQHRPSRGQGLKNPYIYEIKQTDTNPPRFEILVNDPKILHFSYIRFLQNNLRDEFKIVGTPIQIEVKKWQTQKH